MSSGGGDEDLQQLAVELGDLWRRSRPFRESVLLLATLTDDAVNDLIAATSSEFDIESAPPADVPADEWAPLVRALTTLYVLVRGRGVARPAAVRVLLEVVGEEAPQPDRLEVVLARLLDPERSDENKRITQRTALAGALTITEAVNFTIDYRMQERFPDEELILVPLVLVKVVTYDPTDGHHRTFTHQLPGDVAEAMLEELKDILAKRDSMSARLGEQGLA